jgi:hypothetical protein
LADDVELADDMCQNPRTHNIKVGPRKSLAEATYRLKDFQLSQELVGAQKVSVEQYYSLNGEECILPFHNLYILPQDENIPKVKAAKVTSNKSVIDKFKKNASSSRCKVRPLPPCFVSYVCCFALAFYSLKL